VSSVGHLEACILSDTGHKATTDEPMYDDDYISIVYIYCR